MKVLGLIGLSLLGCIIVVLFLWPLLLEPLFLEPLLPEKMLMAYLAFDSAICEGRAGIRHDTPYLYEATKEMYSDGYITCMRAYGHHKIPPLP